MSNNNIIYNGVVRQCRMFHCSRRSRKFKYSTQWSLLNSQHLIDQVIWLFYKYFAHSTSLKTAHALKDICHFPAFTKTVLNIVQACKLSQKPKLETFRVALPMVPILSIKPFDKLCVNSYRPISTKMFQFSYLFVRMDNFIPALLNCTLFERPLPRYALKN